VRVSGGWVYLQFEINIDNIQGDFKVFSRCFQGVFKVFSRCIQGVFKVFST
jgi:hypothetical protein